jgi:hypothetical protein
LRLANGLAKVFCSGQGRLPRPVEGAHPPESEDMAPVADRKDQAEKVYVFVIGGKIW